MKYPTEIRKCDDCGLDFTARRYSKTRFCSKTCSSRRKIKHSAEWRAKRKVRMTKWNSKNKDKMRCHDRLHVAVKRGLISKQPCQVCGSSVQIEAHHEDYSKPLDVTWLCHKCHTIKHRPLEARKHHPSPTCLLCGAPISRVTYTHGQIPVTIWKHGGNRYQTTSCKTATPNPSDTHASSSKAPAGVR